MLEGDSSEPTSTATSVSGEQRTSPDRCSPVASGQSMPSLMSLNVPPPPVLADAPLLPLTAVPVRRDGDPALQQLHILVISQPGAGSSVAQAASIHPYAGTRENSRNAQLVASQASYLAFREVISQSKLFPRWSRAVRTPRARL